MQPSTPYFTISVSDLLDQYDKMKGFAHTVNYSAKTNYDIVSVLEDKTDAGFSVHFQQALNYIDDTDRVTYFVQGTTGDELDELHDQGITTFVIDNEPDLDIFEAWAENQDDDLTVLARLRLKEHSVETGKHYVFGMPSDDVNRAVQELNEIRAVDSLGVHVHRKTQNVAEWRLNAELSNSLADTTLQIIDRVNAGGGFPIQYKNYQRDTLPSIKQRFEELQAWTARHGCELIIEPGRIIAGPPGELHTSIINVYDDTVVVDASVFNAAMDTFATNTRLEIKDDVSDGSPYTIKGRTPDSLDIIRYKARLDSPERGDTITFENATAYNYSSDFCDLPTPETRLLE